MMKSIKPQESIKVRFSIWAHIISKAYQGYNGNPATFMKEKIKMASKKDMEGIYGTMVQTMLDTGKPVK